MRYAWNYFCGLSFEDATIIMVSEIWASESSQFKWLSWLRFEDKHCNGLCGQRFRHAIIFCFLWPKHWARNKYSGCRGLCFESVVIVFVFVTHTATDNIMVIVAYASNTQQMYRCLWPTCRKRNGYMCCHCLSVGHAILYWFSCLSIERETIILVVVA